MDRIWLVIMDWKSGEDYDTEFRAYSSKEKAIEVFNQMVKQEKENSWIGDYSIDEFDDYEENETFFNAEMYCEPLRTTIYIQEKEIEK